jgi:hypothetical protein
MLLIAVMMFEALKVVAMGREGNMMDGCSTARERIGQRLRLTFGLVSFTVHSLGDISR